jgi:ABC-2 type transport system ATP-binding protein
MIRIEGLSKYYGDVCAVDNISFDIKRGEILGLLGPNGAGKTTTLRVLACYLLPTSGSVTVKDFNIYEHPLEIKGIMGYLPESAPLYPDMLVYDYLAFVAGLRELGGAAAESRIRELAVLCGIRDVMHKSVHELSKGYRQRVGLAHAMINDPEILVLDEPTSGLDPNQIVEIRNIIREIGREKTVVLSTHILSEAEAACDRLVIIDGGRIVADGATDELKRGAAEEYVVDISLVGADFGDVEGAMGAVDGVKGVRLKGPGNGQLDLSVTCVGKRDVRAELYAVIKDMDWTLIEFHMQTRTLENIFRELTGGE